LRLLAMCKSNNVNFNYGYFLLWYGKKTSIKFFDLNYLIFSFFHKNNLNLYNIKKNTFFIQKIKKFNNFEITFIFITQYFKINIIIFI
jgi:hypothetical protein